MEPTLPDLVSHINAEVSSGTALERLEMAVSMGAEMTTTADALVGHFVEAARAEGFSWSQIGSVLGVSKQAIQQKFSSKWAVPGTPWSADFSRFTGRARQALLTAEREARQRGHNYIGTEHLLLGAVADPDGLAAKILEALGSTAVAVGEAVERRVKNSTPLTSGLPLPFTPKAKDALAKSLVQALDFMHNYIGTEHLLLGIAREGTGVGAEVLEELGLTSRKLADAATALLAAYK